MSESSRSRRLVALIAAYVVALQVLLLPLSVATGVPVGASLCAGVASTGDSAPVGDQSGCPCAAGCGMQCCAQGALGSPPQLAIALAVAQEIAPPPARYNVPVQKPPAQGPQLPRPPPAA